MKLPTVLVPGLNCSARLWSHQIEALWRFGPVQVADHTGADTLGEITGQILAAAPPRFALAGLSMGGYIAFEIMRRAPERVARLALLGTGARPDSPAARDMRLEVIGLAESGRFAEVHDRLWAGLVHKRREADEALRATCRAMAQDVGPKAFVRQVKAIMGRPDSRPDLPRIACPTLVLVGDGDTRTPPELAHEMVAGIPGARLVIVPGAGHLATIETPEETSRALVKFFEQG